MKSRNFSILLGTMLAAASLSTTVRAAETGEVWTNTASTGTQIIDSTQSAPAKSAEPAQVPDKFNRVRIFLALDGQYSAIGGDFKGEKFLTASDKSQSLLIPDVSGGGGMAARFGVRNFRPGAVDFGAEGKVAFSSLDWKEGSLNGNAELVSIDGSILLYFNTPTRLLSPYLSIGMYSELLAIEEGAFSATKRDTAVYSGYGLSLGAGAEWLMGEHWALQGGFQFRGASMNTVTGIDSKRFKLDESLGLTAFTPRLSLMWYF